MSYKLTVAFMTMAIAAPVFAEDAVCYNCPPQWADWASMLEAIDKEIDIQMPHDNKNSGQTLSQLLAEKDNPIADVAYYGVTTGIKAGNKGVATAYKPAKFDEIPDGLKDPDGKWFAIHYGTLGFFVNVDALAGAEVPQCFADLTKPEYKGMVGYLDPSSAFVGYAGAVAANIAFGGDLDNFDQRSSSSTNWRKTLQSCPSRLLMRGLFRAKFRSCLTMISTPIAANTKRTEILNSSCHAKDRYGCLT